ncbi:MAG: lipoyl synthase, partial [Deltaproteobacteria bacterium]|nr:lipoyl synthase [Deltaproteobacteria bacterium]
LHPEATTKSGFMVGLGERQEEVSSLLRDLRKANCDLVTIGQYLRPSRNHHPVVDYIHPELFQAYQQEVEELGFSGVASGPYVRSSYQAEKLYRQAKGISGAEA